MSDKKARIRLTDREDVMEYLSMLENRTLKDKLASRENHLNQKKNLQWEECIIYTMHDPQKSMLQAHNSLPLFSHERKGGRELCISSIDFWGSCKMYIMHSSH